MKLKERISENANLDELSPEERKYYEYIIKMQQLQDTLFKYEKQIYNLQMLIDTTIMAKYRNEIYCIDAERTQKNLEIITNYSDDIKKHHIKYFFFKSKKQARTKEYKEEVEKNNIIYDSQISILKENMAELLEDEERRNASVHEQINLLNIKCSEIKSQMALLRDAYFGENLINKRYIKK